MAQLGRPPRVGKEIAGKIVDYLRQNGGTAVLDGKSLANKWSVFSNQ